MNNLIFNTNTKYLIHSDLKVVRSRLMKLVLKHKLKSDSVKWLFYTCEDILNMGNQGLQQQIALRMMSEWSSLKLFMFGLIMLEVNLAHKLTAFSSLPCCHMAHCKGGGVVESFFAFYFNLNHLNQKENKSQGGRVQFVYMFIGNSWCLLLNLINKR